MVVLDATHGGTPIAAAETGGAVATLTTGESGALGASVITSIGWWNSDWSWGCFYWQVKLR